MFSCVNSTCLSPTVGAAGGTFLAAIQYFALQQCLIPELWPSDTISDGDEFDFVIIGAGSSGSVVAARLSEIQNWKVLLVEAGGPPPVESKIPGFLISLMKSQYDWNYTIIDNRSTETKYYSRGKTLGGSGAINYMMYYRGSQYDYDSWQSQQIEGWGWDSVLPYFIKLENMTVTEILQSSEASALHGIKGPVKISKGENFEDIIEIYLNSYEEIGFKPLLEMNGVDQFGVSPSLYNIYGGIRQSAAQAYIQPLKNRKNLYVLNNTLATEIKFADDGITATGVNLLTSSNETVYVKASREVIVAGGVINSPQILMLSGIGPKHELEAIDIKSRINLPVGKNFHDNIAVTISFTGSSNPTNEANVNFNYLQYLYNRSGILSSYPGALVSAFFKLDTSDTESAPDFQVINNYFPAGSESSIYQACKKLYSMDEITCLSLVKANEKNDIYTGIIILLHPETRGNVTLKSDKATDQAILRTGIFSSEKDVNMYVKAIKKILQLLDTSYFRSINSSLVQLDIPKCNDLSFGSDEYWRCYVSILGSSTFHGGGTCRMGSDGVVESNGKVKGIKNVRVADLSIIPEPFSTNPNGPAMMIGEKISDEIKKSYGVDVY